MVIKQHLWSFTAKDLASARCMGRPLRLHPVRRDTKIVVPPLAENVVCHRLCVPSHHRQRRVRARIRIIGCRARLAVGQTERVLVKEKSPFTTRKEKVGVLVVARACVPWRCRITRTVLWRVKCRWQHANPRVWPAPIRSPRHDVLVVV